MACRVETGAEWPPSRIDAEGYSALVPATLNVIRLAANRLTQIKGNPATSVALGLWGVIDRPPTP